MNYDKIKVIEKEIREKRFLYNNETDPMKKRKIYLELQIELLKLKLEKL